MENLTQEQKNRLPPPMRRIARTVATVQAANGSRAAHGLTSDQTTQLQQRYNAEAAAFYAAQDAARAAQAAPQAPPRGGRRGRRRSYRKSYKRIRRSYRKK